MNVLAEELNGILEGTAASALLSDFGKRIYFPKGIVSQSAEAKARANRFNATIGMAYQSGHPIELEAVKQYTAHMSPAETVAYAPTPGDPELRALWKKEIYRKNPSLGNAVLSEPLVTSGLTHGISLLADLFVDPDQDVLVSDMFWGNYRLIFEERRQGHLKTFPFYSAEGGLNLEGLKDLMDKSSSEKIVLIVNFPNNPTGYSPTNEEMDGLKDLILAQAEAGKKLMVITDDAYFGLFYEEGTATESLFSRIADLHPNVLAAKVDGATKEHFVWGFRLGFVTFGSKGMTEDQHIAMNKKLGGALRASVSNVSRPAQSLMKKAMADPDYEPERSHWDAVLKDRYHVVREILETRTAGKSLKELPFNSGYFMSFAFEGSAEELRLALLDKGIGTISIQDKYLRVAYASVDKHDIKPLYEEIFATADELTSK